jgi:hypothetical protein
MIDAGCMVWSKGAWQETDRGQRYVRQAAARSYDTAGRAGVLEEKLSR